MRIPDNNKWTFPDVDYIAGDELATLEANVEQSNHLIRLYELENEIIRQQNEIIRLNNELEAISSLHASQIDNMKKLYQQLNASMPMLNGKLLTMMSNVIKQIVKKIIYKEMHEDNNVIKSIIKKVLDQADHDGLIVVEVSDADYVNVCDIDFDKPIKIKVNGALKPGDIIVTSNTQGYMHRIDETINLIMTGQV